MYGDLIFIYGSLALTFIGLALAFSLPGHQPTRRRRRNRRA